MTTPEKNLNPYDVFPKSGDIRNRVIRTVCRSRLIDISKFVAMFDGVCQPNGGVGRFFLPQVVRCTSSEKISSPTLVTSLLAAESSGKAGTVRRKVEDYDYVCACKEFESVRASKMVIFAGRNRLG